MFCVFIIIDTLYCDGMRDGEEDLLYVSLSHASSLSGMGGPR